MQFHVSFYCWRSLTRTVPIILSSLYPSEILLSGASPAFSPLGRTILLMDSHQTLLKYYFTFIMALYSLVHFLRCVLKHAYFLGSIHIKKRSQVTSLWNSAYCGMKWHSWLTLVYSGFWEQLEQDSPPCSSIFHFGFMITLQNSLALLTAAFSPSCFSVLYTLSSALGFLGDCCICDAFSTP